MFKDESNQPVRSGPAFLRSQSARPQSEKSIHTPAGTFGRELLENFPPTQTGVLGAVEAILFSADVNQ